MLFGKLFDLSQINQIVKDFGSFTPDKVTVEQLGNFNSQAIQMMKNAGWD